MSKGMLGKLPLSATQGPRSDLEEKLAGPRGDMWLRRLNLLLREEKSIGIPRTFKITTHGRLGEQFIMDLEGQGIIISNGIKAVFRRNDQFVATNGKAYRLELIMGNELKEEPTDEDLMAEATLRGYCELPVEVVPYVAEMFSFRDFDEAGLDRLIFMHAPIDIWMNTPCRIGFKGSPWLELTEYYVKGKCSADDAKRVAFVFLVPKKQR